MCAVWLAGRKRRDRGSKWERRPRLLGRGSRPSSSNTPRRKSSWRWSAPRGALVEMLLPRPRMAVVPVNPVVLHRFRQAFAPSGAKDDPGDAALLADIVRTHPERFAALRPAAALLAELAALVRERRHWVDTRTKLVEQLIAVLEKYYPQGLKLAGKTVSSPMPLEFLQHWPDLPAAKRAKWSILERFYRQHHSGREEVLQERYELLNTARSVSENEASITELYAEAPGHEVIDSLSGAGEALAPRLWVACASKGNDPNAATMQLRSGIAPVQKQGGNSKVVCFRWARPRFLHQTWTEFAHHSIKTCSWAGAYYHARKAKGHGDGAILRALAFKWIRIVARLWKDQAPYNEAFYLAHCSARLATA